MMRRRASNGLAALLAVTCAALALFIFGQLRQPAEPVSAASTAKNPVALAPEVPSAFAMPAQETFFGIVERPVFADSRRPVPGREPDGGSSPVFDFEVVGIVVTGSDRFVLVKAGDGAPPEPVREGQVVAGWSVQAISVDHVRLRRGATEMDVALDYTLPAPPSAMRPRDEPIADEAVTAGQPAGDEPPAEEPPTPQQ